MLRNVQQLISATSQVVRKRQCQRAFPLGLQYLSMRGDFFPAFDQKNFFHVNSPRMKDHKSIEKRRDVLAASKLHGVVVGEKSSAMELHIESDMFPTHDLPYKLFNDIPFKDLPIVHVKTTKNNTIIGLTDKSVQKLITSCGREGFKNTKKGTNIAAQVTGTSFGIRALKKGYKTVKVLIKGIGPGRLSALKGLQFGGLNIVSITDQTVDQTSVRPKKQRRI